MMRPVLVSLPCVITSLIFVLLRLPSAHALSAAFTYQGQLQQNGILAADACDFEFSMFATPTGGGAFASQFVPAVSVVNGLFTVELDYGASVFPGDDRWLQISVRCPAGVGSMTTLSPRQRLTAVPYALHASTAGSVAWSGIDNLPAGFADGTDQDTLGGLSCTSGQIAKWNGAAWACAADGGALYTAGTGLLLSGSQFNLAAPYQLPQVCGTGQVAKWNGTVWACGTDNDSSLNAGAGLTVVVTLTGPEYRVNFAPVGGPNGSANMVARSDHTHYGASWSGFQKVGLAVQTTPPVAVGDGIAAVRGRAYEGSSFSPHEAGVWGDSGSGIGVFGSSSFGVGVEGRSLTAVGVAGSSDEKAGTSGTSRLGPGVSAKSSGSGVLSPALYAEAMSSTGIAIHAVSNSTDANLVVNNAGTGDLLRAFKIGNLRFRVDNSGDVYADGSYNCGLSSGCFNTGAGADLAERIDSIETLGPGDLVEIEPDHPQRFRRARTAYSTLVAGVISSTPGITMNNADLAENDRGVRTDERPLLALAGQAPVRVTSENGRIRPGDMLVASSTPGHAMRAGPSPPVGTVVGKALNALAGRAGLIEMLVMLR